MVVVKAKRGQAMFRLCFDDLASFEPNRSLGERAYEAWTHALPDGPRGLAFALEKNKRGATFMALMEQAIRRRRPDLLSGHGSADIDMKRNRLMEPSDLWSL